MAVYRVEVIGRILQASTSSTAPGLSMFCGAFEVYSLSQPSIQLHKLQALQRC